jgi:hypothetical protein
MAFYYISGGPGRGLNRAAFFLFFGTICRTTSVFIKEPNYICCLTRPVNGYWLPRGQPGILASNLSWEAVSSKDFSVSGLK